MLDFFILNENNKIVKASLEEWWERFENEDFYVKRTLVGGKLVLTVFNGIHNKIACPGPPLLFETMILEAKTGWETLYCQKYGSHIEATEGHYKAVVMVEQGKFDG